MSDDRDLTDEEIAALPIVAPHTVPHAVDGHRWAFRGGGNPELGDGLGGFLRVAPQSAADQEADDEYLLAGEELYQPGGDDPLEDDRQAERRRRLLRVLRRNEIEPAWDHRLLSRARRTRD